jgi:hypothetical protein
MTRRGWLAGLAAVPVALLGLLLGAGSASATTGGCLVPYTAASYFGSHNIGFFDDVELSDDAGHRKNQCKDFLKGCKKIVKHTTNCMESAISSVEDGELESCKDIEDKEDREICKDEVKGGADSFFDFLDENKADAYEICQACYEDCLEGITGDCSPVD